MASSGSKDTLRCTAKKKVLSTKEAIRESLEAGKLISEHSHYTAASGAGPCFLVATDNSRSDEVGSLEIARHPSTRNLPKTTNVLAYAAGI